MALVLHTQHTRHSNQRIIMRIYCCCPKIKKPGESASEAVCVCVVITFNFSIAEFKRATKFEPIAYGNRVSCLRSLSLSVYRILHLIELELCTCQAFELVHTTDTQSPMVLGTGTCANDRMTTSQTIWIASCN